MKLKALAERHIPGVAAVTVVLVHRFVWPQSYPRSATELLNNVVSLSGIAVGFLATGQALLCSLSDNFVVQFLKKYSRFQDMLRFFSAAIRWCLCLALFSLAGYWVDFQKHAALFSVWLGLLSGASLTTMRVLLLFGRVLHGSTKE